MQTPTPIHRAFASVALAATLALLPATSSVAQAQTARRSSGLAAPVTGTATAADGTCAAPAGTFTIQRFARSQGRFVAVGTLVATLTSDAPGSAARTIVTQASIPLHQQQRHCGLGRLRRARRSRHPPLGARTARPQPARTCRSPRPGRARYHGRHRSRQSARQPALRDHRTARRRRTTRQHRRAAEWTIGSSGITRGNRCATWTVGVMNDRPGCRECSAPACQFVTTRTATIGRF